MLEDLVTITVKYGALAQAKIALRRAADDLERDAKRAEEDDNRAYMQRFAASARVYLDALAELERALDERPL